MNWIYKIMVPISDNSGDVVVGALACGTDLSGFKSHFYSSI